MQGKVTRKMRKKKKKKKDENKNKLIKTEREKILGTPRVSI